MGKPSEGTPFSRARHHGYALDGLRQEWHRCGVVMGVPYVLRLPIHVRTCV